MEALIIGLGLAWPAYLIASFLCGMTRIRTEQKYRKEAEMDWYWHDRPKPR